jgi:hypothetical protein
METRSQRRHKEALSGAGDVTAKAGSASRDLPPVAVIATQLAHAGTIGLVNAEVRAHLETGYSFAGRDSYGLERG